MTTRKSWYGARVKYMYPGYSKDYRKGHGGGHMSADSWTKEQNIYFSVLGYFPFKFCILKGFKYVLFKNALKNQFSYIYLLMEF